MKIATWNVNSLTARWPRVAEWLETTATDVVLVQETKQTDAKFPLADLAALGYESAHYGQGQWNGVAIFSRVGLDDVVTGLGADEAVSDQTAVDGRAGRDALAGLLLEFVLQRDRPPVRVFDP